MATQVRASETIARVFDAAAGMFVDETYAVVTMDRVAEAAGVTKGALYHHFSSKESLYEALLLKDLAEKRDLFLAAAGELGTARERLGRLTEAYFKLPQSKRERITLVRRDAHVFERETRDRVVRAYQAALPEVIEAILIDGMKNDELAPADARLLSWDFVALVEVSLSPHAGRVFPGPAAKVDHVLQLFFDGAAVASSLPTGP